MEEYYFKKVILGYFEKSIALAFFVHVIDERKRSCVKFSSTHDL